MSTNITGGVVSIEDGKKAPEEYAPPRKVRVELRFDVKPDAPNGTDDLDITSDIVLRKVAELLGIKLPSLTGKERTPAEIAAADKAKQASAAKRPPAPPKDGELTVEEPKADPKPGVQAQVVDDLGDLLGTAAEPAKPITDADLTAAITRKNEKLKQPVKIRELIMEFSPKDKAPSAALIPQEKRQTFLDKLAALTA